jgi:methylmalonyl-CoA/ethylmalonyl-CoA epimerase
VKSSKDTSLAIVALSHVGFAVRDIEAFADSWGSLLGVGPWSVHEERATNGVVVYGQPVEKLVVRVAFGRIGGLAVELIETVEGETCHSRALSEVGPGLHHIAFWVEDLDAEVQKARDHGLAVVMAPSALQARIDQASTGELFRGSATEAVEETGVPSFFAFLGDPGSAINFTLELLDVRFLEEYQRLNQDTPMRPGEIHR